MKWFLNMKIATKLILGFLIVAIIAGVVGGIGLINLNKMATADELLYEENTLGIEYALEAASYFQRIRFNSMKMLTVDSLSEKEKCISNIKEYTNEVERYFKLYEDGIVAEIDRIQFDEVTPNWNSYKTMMNNAITMVQSGDYEGAENIILIDIGPAGDAIRMDIDDLVEYNSAGGQERAATNTQLAKTSTLTMAVVIAIGVIVAVFLGIFISRIISNPVKEMVEAADVLAQGDVNVDIRTNTKDEIGNLASSFRGMIANIREQARVAEKIAAGDLTVDVKVRSEKDLLNQKFFEIVEKNNEIMSNIVNASEQVAAGSKQVSDSSMALSQGAAEQASSVEELTASLEEVSSQTDINAKNAGNANELAEAAKNNAIDGNSKMQEMVKAMEEINESSANISKIIKVIDDIAFQTNILALNAAVEAARAGQHGKGFAVVAEEVRNLAARSANAAKETTDMIEGSIKKSEGGTRIANETAEALNKIVGDVAKAAELVGDIASASNEQANAIGQINQGIMQVSQVVQSNSATSEEGAAASEELSGQADLLKEMVGKFKLKGIDRSYSKSDELSPEVLKMIESMTEKKKGETEEENKVEMDEENRKKAKIVLSDKEFGKY
ncbi:MAG: methyl-accepting chemotaxis protein [Firmicutes bacterium]|nr:methyl-accepting chemotaxis protein [Bacillota bacterium]